MQNKKFKNIVLIGRFQMFHNGHQQVVNTARELADNVIVVVGSAHQPRTIKNPWTYLERAGMIFDACQTSDAPNNEIVTVAVRDQLYNDQQWVSNVQAEVNEVFRKRGLTGEGTAIIGHPKDESSYYLKMFPQWERVEHGMNDIIHATDLRELYFEGMNLKFLQSLVPSSVYKFLEKFKKTEAYDVLVQEYKFIKKYKSQWVNSPYPPIFVTTDAIVVQSGHVLLVQRKASPGMGQWALPGGFIKESERLEDSMIRELREETRLRVPVPVLKGNIKAQRTFDHPNRSLRGRTITHAYLIELPSGELPAIRSGSDAKKVQWIPISEVDSNVMFEDHFDVLHYFLGTI